MDRKFLTGFVLTILLLFAACSSEAPTPAPTPTSEATPLPPATDTPAPTITHTPPPAEHSNVDESTPAAYSGFPTPTPMAAEPSMNLLVFSSNLAAVDQVLLNLRNVPAPPIDQVYQGWLVNEDGSFTDAGLLTAGPGGTIEHSWTTPDGANLLSRVTGFQVTLEPTAGSRQPSGKVVYSGEMSPEDLFIARSLFLSNQGEPATPRNKPFASGLTSQADLADQHVVNAINAAAIGATAEMRIHVEHVINILEGSKGARFGDYNGDSSTDNPGDGFGMLAYADQIVALLGTSEELVPIQEQIKAGAVVIEEKCAAIFDLSDPAQVKAALDELKSLMDSLQQETIPLLYHAAQQATAIEIHPVP